jgi:quercetin dioxygenase-like cupin family protein
MEIGETIEAPNMGMRLTRRESGPKLKFDLWMRGDAAPIPMHVHPRQEERITVVRGSVRSRSGKVDRVLGPGDEVVSPPGEVHTVGPAADEEVEMLAELTPALGYEQFMERSFARPRRPCEQEGSGKPTAACDSEATRGRVLCRRCAARCSTCATQARCPLGAVARVREVRLSRLACRPCQPWA